MYLIVLPSLMTPKSKVFLSRPLSHYSIDCYSLPLPSLSVSLSPPPPPHRSVEWLAVKVEYFEDNSRGCLADPELAAEVRESVGCFCVFVCRLCPCYFDSQLLVHQCCEASVRRKCGGLVNRATRSSLLFLCLFTHAFPQM